MNHIVDLLVTLGFLGALMWGMMRFMLREIHRDISELKQTMLEMKDDMRNSNQRIDHLYQICIDLLKERK